MKSYGEKTIDKVIKELKKITVPQMEHEVEQLRQYKLENYTKELQKYLKLSNWKKNYSKLLKLKEKVAYAIHDTYNQKEDSKASSITRKLSLRLLAPLYEKIDLLIKKYELLKQIDEAETAKQCADLLAKVNFHDAQLARTALKIAKKNTDDILILPVLYNGYLYNPKQFTAFQEIYDLLYTCQAEETAELEKVTAELKNYDDTLEEIITRNEERLRERQSIMQTPARTSSLEVKEVEPAPQPVSPTKKATTSKTTTSSQTKKNSTKSRQQSPTIDHTSRLG